ncbi:sporulation-induced protein [Sporothrix epigloea]|uniref:Sporulation-induced protein n=1 Tax=Sporothrix epigloea TaxID=1892477 RepID=A0ABP0E0U0_9PEZI
MFWKFGGYANISPIDAILDRPEFTLEELLDESDLLGDVKAHNDKLLDYLRQRDIVLRMLEYVVAPKTESTSNPEVTGEEGEEQSDATSTPWRHDPAERGRHRVFGRSRASSSATDAATDEEDQAERKRTRYAFVSCEILASDSWSICDTILDPANRTKLAAFWQFLKRPAPLDPLQASYFTKVNESLFDKKLDEMVAFLKSTDNAIQDMLRHVDCPMVMDLLLKIITLDRPEAHQSIVEWLYTQDIVPTLISFLSPENSWATQTSAGDFIKAIITVSANATQQEQTCIGPNELTRQLVSQPCINELIGYMLKGGNALTVGVGIIIEVIRKNNSDYDPDFGTEANPIPSSRDPIYLGTLLRMFAQNVPNFMQLMINAPAQKSRLNSTFGEKIEPFGFDRFKTCELMAELLHCSNMGLLNEVGSEEMIAARDALRKRLQSEGKLAGTCDVEASTGSDVLTMAISHTDEGRRLEVTNTSAADDDGFEEVTHAAGLGEDETTAELELPIRPGQSLTLTSFIEKDDDDFVEEPLSSPRLKTHDEKLTSSDDHHFDDPELLVAPLSPTKKSNQSAPKDDADGSDDFVTEATEPALGDEAKRLVPDLEKGDDSDTSIMFAPTISSLPDSFDLSHETCTPNPVSEPAISIQETTPEQPVEKTEISAVAAIEPDEKSSTADFHASQESTADSKIEAESSNAPMIDTDSPDAEAAVADSPGKSSEPVVGDFLKMQFVEHRVVPTILSFFFSYPWNNFLHNVVYDVVQQVFNGPMDRGFNPQLAISLFESADITTKIVNGQLVSEQSQAAMRMRMGYMGHLTLIAEEVVKFSERHPAELLSETVVSKIMSPDWTNYIDGTLAETRERDNATLGGVRPEAAMGNHAAQASLAASGMDSLGFSSGSQHSATNVLADAGLGGSLGSQSNSDNLDLQSSNDGNFSISAGISSGFHSSSDEEDEDADADDNDEDINNEVSKFPMHLNRRFELASGGCSVFTSNPREAQSVAIDELYNAGDENCAKSHSCNCTMQPVNAKSLVESFGVQSERVAVNVEECQDHRKEGNRSANTSSVFPPAADDALLTKLMVPSGASSELFTELENIGPIELRSLAGLILDSFSDSAGIFTEQSGSGNNDGFTVNDNHSMVTNYDAFDRIADYIAAPTTADDFHRRVQNAAELFRAFTDPLNASNSLLPPAIPPPPPPPPPLNVPPSRARQLLAARLAMNKRNAESTETQEDGGGSGGASNDNGGDISLGVAPGFSNVLDNVGSDDERLRNPFADDEDDDIGADDNNDVNDDSGDDDHDDDVGLNSFDVGRVGLKWNRGGWWRSMVSLSDRKAAASAGSRASIGLGDGNTTFNSGKFGDGRDSSSDGNSSDDDDDLSRVDRQTNDGSANGNKSLDDDDEEEFGDFAMPEEERCTAQTLSANAIKEGDKTGNGEHRDTTLFKPLALHPNSQSSSLPFSAMTSGPNANVSGGSLWRLGFLSGLGNEPATTTDDNAKTTPFEDELEVIDEDGQRVARVTEASHHKSLEDPDEDEVVI